MWLSIYYIICSVVAKSPLHDSESSCSPLYTQRSKKEISWSLQQVYIDLRYQEGGTGATGRVSLLDTAKSLERGKLYSFVYAGKKLLSAWGASGEKGWRGLAPQRIGWQRLSPGWGKQKADVSVLVWRATRRLGDGWQTPWGQQAVCVVPGGEWGANRKMGRADVFGSMHSKLAKAFGSSMQKRLLQLWWGNWHLKTRCW